MHDLGSCSWSSREPTAALDPSDPARVVVAAIAHEAGKAAVAVLRCADADAVVVEGPAREAYATARAWAYAGPHK